ncbi:hypothetical protein ACRYI5_03350 [Furfurilactobacillus sp. WILCCON 0119]|uniref:hypothetical protein n=1 Tax=Furfurilactobacillus entadae TaxID=2922307 RepID=UPI0035ECAB1B
MKQHLSSNEQETILSIDGEKKRWHIYTSRSLDFKKYSSVLENQKITRYDDGQVMSIEGDLKESWYIPKPREHKKRELTDEQRAELVERGRHLSQSRV